MSDEPSESKSACPHTDAVGTRWGDPISKERQAELKALADKQREWAAKSKAERGESHFDGVKLTGADASWLAEMSGRTLLGQAPNLHLEGATLFRAHLEGADLRSAGMEGADLSVAYLEGADLSAVHLERASLWRARLEGAELRFAHLEGAGLQETHLERANLRGASFDKTSRLNGAVLTRVSFDQVSFDNTNLTVVDWSPVDFLGDEVTARKAKEENPLLRRTRVVVPVTEQSSVKSDVTRLNEFKAAVRANRVLAVALRSQGLNEDADRFAYRAQFLQRQVLRRQGRLLSALSSWFLDRVAGYGYKPMRSFLTYLLVILGFAAAYFALGGANGKPLSWNEAIVVSMTAFHGRGFFSAVFQPGDIQAAVAAVEAFIGLLIEIVFIATFTQRFFSR